MNNTLNLIIDQGNSRTKLALFHIGKILKTSSLESLSRQALSDFLQTETPEKAIFSGVAKERFPDFLKEFPFETLCLSAKTRLPFPVRYKTPETLGNDRRALAAAAVSQFPAKDVLVIDAGTCVTYDFVNRAGEYLGGGISPGLQMRLKALHHFTARLPLIQEKTPPDLIGDSTENSILSGAVGGWQFEIERTIAAYSARFPELIILLTGGDLERLSRLPKNGIFAAPNFLLEGLHFILDSYVQKP